MAISNWSGPISSASGFIVPITYVYAADVDNNGDYYIQDPGARILILSTADGGPASSVNFILPEVTLPEGVSIWTGPQSAREQLNGIEGSITNYDGVLTHTLVGANSQPVSGNPAGVTIGVAAVVQWACNGNPNAPWLAISTNVLTS